MLHAVNLSQLISPNKENNKKTSLGLRHIFIFIFYSILFHVQQEPFNSSWAMSWNWKYEFLIYD